MGPGGNVTCNDFWLTPVTDYAGSLTFVDNITDDFKAQKGQELFGLSLSTRTDAITYLLEGRDPWLKTVALYSLTADPLPELDALVRKAKNDPHPVVQETARLVLGNG